MSQVLAADPKLLQRLQPHLKRLMILDPNPASARLLADLVKGLGGREVYFEPDERRALEMCRELDPMIIFTERSGPRLDGESFTRKVRRSTFACRKTPVIMVTADATASTIKGARDCGVHEFLRKPYTAGDLLKRIAVVTLKSRNWVEAVGYVGPDRRRFNSGEFTGERKRNADKAQSRAEVEAAERDQAVRILRSAIGQFDSDPSQALRAIREQTSTLKRMAIAGGEARLAVAVSDLETALTGAAPTRMSLFLPIQAVVDLFPDLAPSKQNAA